MTDKAITLRMDDKTHAALTLISKLIKIPKSKLVLEAVHELIEEKSLELLNDMDAIALQLKAYKKGDPNYAKAIKAFVDAEVSYDDPAEGQVILEKPTIVDKVNLSLEGG